MNSVVRTQIVIDAFDPHGLAGFWAEALRYEPEDIHDFVQVLVDAGHVPREITLEIDGKRRWKDMASLRHPDDGIDERGAGTGRRILFQRVPEIKTLKNRVHLDLLVGPEACDTEVERLTQLGATFIDIHDGPDGRWILMTDPEGNEFDVS